MTEGAIDRLNDLDVDDVVDVLCESFYHYPVMRFVLGHDNVHYDSQLRTLIGFFVAARSLRNEPMFGIRSGDDLAATVIVSRPGVGESPAELATVREATWSDLGDAARFRYEAFGEAVGPFVPDERHLHINMIGVRRGAQGRGFGRIMLDHVHGLSRSDPDSSGVSLTTEEEANVTLYQHFGYEIVGHAVVGPSLQSWSFFRPDDA
jgi:ribosomal protein S18 acetylase RimI-like enzyme